MSTCNILWVLSYFSLKDCSDMSQNWDISLFTIMLFCDKIKMEKIYGGGVMYCPKCGRLMRMFSERKLDFRRYKKYKCDTCKKITELEIDNNDRIVKTNHYDDKF